MKLNDIYRAAIETAMAHDPRGREAVERDLAKAKKEIEKLKDDEKEFADEESTKNPYADSRILHGDPDTHVAAMLVGIDIDVQELLLAERLGENGRPVDAVMSHHPSGSALARLHCVMGLQADILHTLGVPIHVAEGLMAERIGEVERKLLPNNHTRAADAARLLDVPLLCLHTAADNMVASYLQKRFDEENPETLSDVVGLLMEEPEYRDSKKQGFGPAKLLGSDSRRAGKIFVDMTGGTSGSKDIFASLSSSGVSTIVGMHMDDEHKKKAQENQMNVVIAGHMASDNLGVNLLLDAVLDEGVEVVECSGFRRFSRIRRGE